MIKIEMTAREAKFLWELLKDVLSQDAEGKNNGTGGVLFPEDVGCAMRIMTPIATALDELAKNEKPKSTLKLL